MGWADDMYDAGYTSQHGGLMDDCWYDEGHSSSRSKSRRTSSGNNKGKPWSDSARYKVAALYADGHSVEEIADEFKRTPYAIAWQLFNLGKLSSSQRDSFKS